MLHNGVVSGDVGASIWHQLRQTHLAPIEYHVRPRLPLPVERLDSSIATEPRIDKQYLRLGARVLGLLPANFPDFNTADLLHAHAFGRSASRYHQTLLGA